MNDLAVVLDELVASAPLEKASWTDVATRSGRLGGLHFRRKRVVLAVAIVLLLALAGTAVGVGVDLLTQQERFHASMPEDPRRLGPLVEIVSGDDWALIAWRSEDGICLDFAIPGNSPFGCGFPVRGANAKMDAGSGPPRAVAGFFSGGNLAGGDGNATIFGVAEKGVAAVMVELRDGQVVKAPLYDAPRALRVELRFFIVRLVVDQLEGRGESPVRAYRAYDEDGKLIERIED